MIRQITACEILLIFINNIYNFCDNLSNISYFIIKQRDLRMPLRHQKTASGIYLLAVSILLSTCMSRISTLRLYDLQEGRTIHAQLSEPNYQRGTILSIRDGNENFEGEYYYYGNRARISQYREMESFLDDTDLAERYGFGKNTDARPVGSAVMIGDKGTVIQIIFYQADPNLNAGDGIGSDNKGNFYRVYLSKE